MSKKIGKRKVEVHKMEGLYPCVRLEDFLFVVKQLEQENKKLKEENAKLKDRIITDESFEEKLDNENKKLKEDVDYRHHRAMVAERGGEDED